MIPALTKIITSCCVKPNVPIAALPTLGNFFFVSPLSSQAGMTAPGTRRHIFDRKLNLENCDASTISLQMGTNKVASQQGMTTYGLPRQVFDNKYCSNPAEAYYDNGSEVEFDGYNQYSD